MEPLIRTEQLRRTAPAQILEQERLFAVGFALLFFAILTLPLWGAFVVPQWLAYLILLYDLYWTVQAVYGAVAGVISFRRLVAWRKIDWTAEYLKQGEPVQQVVIIPNLDERPEVLSATLESLAHARYPRSQLSVVLAMEERERGARSKAEALRAQYATRFSHIWITLHALQPQETAAKAGNLTHAARQVRKRAEELGWDAQQVMVTTIDADTRLDPEYLSALAVQYLKSPNRTQKLFQGLLLLLNNLWQAHAPIRAFSAFWTFSYVTGLSHYARMTTAIYSASLQLLETTGYWDPRVVAEDGSFFFRAFFATRGKAEIVPIYLPALLDMVHRPGLGETLVTQFRQMMRWAWTVSNLPYIAHEWQRRSSIPLSRKLKKCLPYIETLVIMPSTWFVITFGVVLPPLIRPGIPFDIFGWPLSQIAPIVLAPTVLGVIVGLWVNSNLRRMYAPAGPTTFGWRMLRMLEWGLLPLAAVFYFSLPYLGAYWRLLSGNELGFDRTPK